MRVAERAGGRGPTVRVPGVNLAASATVAGLSFAAHDRFLHVRATCIFRSAHVACTRARPLARPAAATTAASLPSPINT